MKIKLKISENRLQHIEMILKRGLNYIFILAMILTTYPAFGQEVAEISSDEKPVRAIFESTWLIDNQSVIVPIKGTFQMDILHRFGVVKNGYDDFYGIFAPSNIKLGFGYTIIDNLSIGVGIAKANMTADINLKYALFQQTRSGSFPLSITYFGNIAIDSRANEEIDFNVDSDFQLLFSQMHRTTNRLSYFHQLIIARKLTNKLSLQVAPGLSHYNAVEGYLDQEKEIQPLMKNDHISVAVGGRYKIGSQLSLIANYDQPITEHVSLNPNPNLSFGIEISTSSHAFQVFYGNYKNIVPQLNNVFNNNDLENGEFLLGFNITRLWN